MPAIAMTWGVMHYTEQGQPVAGRPSVVFLNSLGTDVRMWDAVLPYLADGTHVLRLDKRGHGLSETASGNVDIAGLADDVRDLMDDRGVTRAIIVGCSVGGLIAQTIALAAPSLVAGLVLSNTAPKLGAAQMWEDRIAAIEAGGMGPMAAPIIDRWFGPEFRASADVAPWRVLLAHTDVQGYIALCRAIAGADITDLVGQIETPALVIGGTYDQTTPPATVQALADALPNASFHLIEGAGHIPAIEAPQAFGPLMKEFIEGKCL